MKSYKPLKMLVKNEKDCKAYTSYESSPADQAVLEEEIEQRMNDSSLEWQDHSTADHVIRRKCCEQLSLSLLFVLSKCYEDASSDVSTPCLTLHEYRLHQNSSHRYQFYDYHILLPSDS